MTVTAAALNAALERPVNPDGTFSSEFVRFLNNLVRDRKISCGPLQPRTISGGVISILGSFSYYSVDTESAASTDDLDTISNGNQGDVIFLQATNSARTVVVKDGTGNILTNGSSDLSLDNTQDLVIALFDGANWKADLWNIGT